MYEQAFSLEIVTPQRVIFKAEATSLTAPGTAGGFQVLFNHAPLLATLEIGMLKVRDRQGSDTVYATSGGFVEVKENVVSVLVETAERAGDIDVGRAERAKERAQQRLHERPGDLDVARAEAALQRSLNRLRVAGRM